MAKKKKAVPLQVYQKRYVWVKKDLLEFATYLTGTAVMGPMAAGYVENHPMASAGYRAEHDYVQLKDKKMACVAAVTEWLDEDGTRVEGLYYYIGTEFDENKRQELLAKLSDYEKALLGVTP